MQHDYLAIYEYGPGNISGFAPDVPGCASTGHSLEEMRSNLREALEFHFEGLAIHGESIPIALTHSAIISNQISVEWLTLTLPQAIQVCE